MRALLMVLMCSVTLAAQQPAPATVTNQDLLGGLPNDGSKWLMYHGNYFGHRLSPLTQITPENVNQLKAQWTFQTGLTPNFQTTPLLVDNVLYVTGFDGNAWAIDARSGRQIWRYRRNMPDDFRGCCGPNNRGLAVHGDKLFLGTGDAHLVALDMKTGDVLWDVELADYTKGYSVTVAPTRREGQGHRRYGRRRVRHPRLHRRVRCEDRQSGRGSSTRWPDPVEPGGQTWPKGSDAYLRGGGSIWVSGHLRSRAEPRVLRHRKSRARLLQPGARGRQPLHVFGRCARRRHGPAEVALPVHAARPARLGFDAGPVLADLTINGTPRKTMLFANRNGFFYVLDRTNGKMILAKPFVTQNWAKGDQPRRAADSHSRHQSERGRQHRRCARIWAAERISFRRPTTRPSGCSSSTRGRRARSTSRGTSRSAKVSSTSRAARRVRATRRITARFARSIR